MKIIKIKNQKIFLTKYRKNIIKINLILIIFQPKKMRQIIKKIIKIILILMITYPIKILQSLIIKIKILNFNLILIKIFNKITKFLIKIIKYLQKKMIGLIFNDFIKYN